MLSWIWGRGFGGMILTGENRNTGRKKCVPHFQLIYIICKDTFRTLQGTPTITITDWPTSAVWGKIVIIYCMTHTERTLCGQNVWFCTLWIQFVLLGGCLFAWLYQNDINNFKISERLSVLISWIKPILSLQIKIVLYKIWK